MGIVLLRGGELAVGSAGRTPGGASRVRPSSREAATCALGRARASWRRGTRRRSSEAPRAPTVAAGRSTPAGRRRGRLDADPRDHASRPPGGGATALAPVQRRAAFDRAASSSPSRADPAPRPGACPCPRAWRAASAGVSPPATGEPARGRRSHRNIADSNARVRTASSNPSGGTPGSSGGEAWQEDRTSRYAGIGPREVLLPGSARGGVGPPPRAPTHLVCTLPKETTKERRSGRRRRRTPTIYAASRTRREAIDGRTTASWSY